MALTNTNKSIRAVFDSILTDDKSLAIYYQNTFGAISTNQQNLDKKILTRLICFAEKQPDVAVNHNIYKTPSSCLERWKWIVGVENNLEKEVKKTIRVAWNYSKIHKQPLLSN